MVKRLLSTYILLIVLPIVLTSSVSYYLYKQSMEDEVSVSVERTIRLLYSEVDGYFVDMVRLSTSIMTEDTQLDDDRNLLHIINERNAGRVSVHSLEAYTQVQRLNHFLNQLLNQKRDLNSVYLYTKSKEIFESHRSESRMTPQKLAYYEQQLMESGREWIMEKDEKDASIYLIRRINDPSHQYLGSIVLSIELSGLNQLMENAQLPKQDMIVLWNRQLPIFDPASKWPEYAIELSPTRIASMNKSFPSGSTLVTYASPQQSEWTLVAYLPYSALTEQIRTVRFWVLTAGGLCVLFSIIVAILLAMGMVKPVKAVRNAMRVMEKGFLNTRVVVRGTDEVAELAEGFNSMSEKLKELIDQVYLSDLAHKEAELIALHAQINPHFLYNTLEAISMVAEMQRPSEAAEMARALGLLFRAATEFEMLVPIHMELMLLKQYLLLQEIRFNGSLHIEYDVQPDVERVLIPKLSLQTVVENCFKHGFAAMRMPRQASIRVKVYAVQQTVSVEIIDNGIGIEQVRLNEIIQHLQMGTAEASHVGLVNVHNRIRLKWGKEFGMLISSRPGIGTAVTLNIPCERPGEQV
ncbi:histidine kinase [Paenibacillus baekrokdamisoli]|uniref:Histidine kinase n=1 Tax=Paenibacillus baekrokdamisoli TaxID=1712516 RepID=A0A3G9JJ23_9BACL|nr:sensor histidine kinase [Paenibacillus baekrokdamisoli]MBB3071928.1 two-component system sensor histidine kinase YesM [Paenibacillus baekrokdamisoli]BBH24088.1 histidine kinase [Paenibacillus baekrokdamisoli]